MVPLKVQFNPWYFQKDVLVNVSFLNALLLFLFFLKCPIIISFFNYHCYCFIFKLPSLLCHFLQSSHFCFIFHPSKKFQAMAGIEPGHSERQAEMINIRPSRGAPWSRGRRFARRPGGPGSNPAYSSSYYFRTLKSNWKTWNALFYLLRKAEE